MAGNIPGTKYSTSKFLNKFGNLAQSSQYRSHIGFTQNLYNALVANDVPRLLLSEAGMLCKATSLPGSAISTHDVRDFYGVVQKSAYMRQFDNTIDLTFYIDSDYQILYMFEAWMEYVMPLMGRNPKGSAYYVANYPDSYRSELYLYKFNKDMDASWGTVGPFNPRGSIVYTFLNIFPVNISSTTVSYDPSQNLEFTVTFSYERYITDKTGVRDPGNMGADSFFGNSIPVLSSPPDNPSSSIKHPKDKETKGGTRWIGVNSTWVNRDGQVIAPREGSEVNQETGEPGQGNQALKDVPRTDLSTQRIRNQQQTSSNTLSGNVKSSIAEGLA